MKLCAVPLLAAAFSVAGLPAAGCGRFRKLRAPARRGATRQAFFSHRTRRRVVACEDHVREAVGWATPHALGMALTSTASTESSLRNAPKLRASPRSARLRRDAVSCRNHAGKEF